MKKKLLSVLLALTMVLTMLPQIAGTQAEAAMRTSRNSGLVTQDEYFDNNEMVRMIVVMDGESLLEQGYTSQSVSKQAKVQTKASQMMEKQDELFSEIAGTTTGTTKKAAKNSITLNYHFTLALNGMSITAPYSELAKIKAMDGVQAAFVAPQYTIVEPKTQESGKMIGREETWADGYTGQGMKIAIIDSGINVSHKAFKALPTDKLTDASMTKDVLQKDLDTYSTTLHAVEMAGKTLTVSDLYRNTKIPYAYNYVGNTTDVEHHGDSDHGTHVAGIAAADKTITSDGTTVVGVAPDAQLMVFKIFDASENSGSFDLILAAIDDAITLGADVINMSLGSTAGFSKITIPDDETSIWTNKVFDNLSKTDTLVEVAAGNEGSSALSNAWGNDLNPSSCPDNSTVGDPSTYEASTAIASIDNESALQQYLTAGGKSVVFSDTLTKTTFKSLAGKKLKFAMVGNLGQTVNDFKKANVKGKIAVVQRGTTTFIEKQANAKAAGAIGCIVYNNVEDGILSMVVEEVLPCVAISLSDGKYLESLAKKGTNTLTINKKQKYFYEGSNIMSSFSSWGVTPDLQLKPEVTAPGGNIYSSTDNNTFGLMSGTSMATPHAAGAAALIKQKLLATGAFTSAGEIRKQVDALMVSTAAPVWYDEDNGVPYSPRLQGAGLMNVYRAVTSNAYLTVNGSDKPKISLGDDPYKTGSYQFQFNVKNTSDHALTFTPETTVLTEDVVDYQTEGIPTFMSETPVLLKDAKVSYQSSGLKDGKITVNSKSTLQVNVTIRLTDAEKAQLTKDFENGIYIDGFVRLIADGAQEVSLTLPYMGFYGDWTAASIFDSCFTTDYNQSESDMYGKFENQDYAAIVGESLNTNSGFAVSHFVVSPNGDGTLDSIDDVELSLMRNAKEITVTYKNHNTGTVYFTEKYPYMYKATYSDDYMAQMTSTVDGFNFTSDGTTPLANGTVVDMVVTGTLDYNKHMTSASNTFTVPITVDTQAPEIDTATAAITKDAATGKTTLKVQMADNTYLAAVVLGQNQFTKILDSDEFEDQEFSTDARGYKTITRTYDITGYGTTFQIMLEDYGYNETYYTVDQTAGTVTKATDSTAKLELPALTDESGTGWDAVLASTKSKIKDAAGEEVDLGLNMGSATVLPKTLLAAIAGKNVLLTATLATGDQFTIDGYDLKKATVKDTNLALTYATKNIPAAKVKKAAGNCKTWQFTIGSGYQLPAELCVNISDLKKKADKNACLYRYNMVTKKLVFVSTSKIDEKGNVTFSITRGGNYLIISGKKK